MKLSSFLAKFSTPFLVIEHTSYQDDLMCLGLQLKQQQGELDVVDKFTTKTIPEIAQKGFSGKKTYLVLTDDQVLTKDVEINDGDQEVLSEAFPNLDLEDFYYQIQRSGNKSFVAISRKQYVDEVVEQYREQKIEITQVFLGNAVMQVLTPFFKNEEAYTLQHQMIYDENALVSIVNHEQSKMHYELEELLLPGKYLIVFATAFYTLTDGSSSGGLEAKNEQLQKGFKEKKLFKNLITYGIGFLFLSLLINFFVFNSTYKKVQSLQEQQQVYTSQQERIEKKQQVVKSKEEIVNSIVNTGFSKSSWYLDQIIQAQPETVLLTAFEFQPLKKTLRKGKPVIVNDNEILVSGITKDKDRFTSWVQRIEQLDFVKDVTIAHYGMEKKGNTTFEIIIKKRHDTEK